MGQRSEPIIRKQGYINGYNDGRFGVNDNVTRAQLAAILYRAAGSPAASGTTRFPDVASTAYYVSAASWAADGGLINGYQDGRFGVNDPITRQQVTAIFWRWAGSPAASAEDYADEASISDYAKTAVDQVCIDLVYAQKDGDGASLVNRIESRNGLHTLEHAEEIGLGNREYQLVNIDG